MTQEECRDSVWAWRDKVREAKARLNLNLLRDVKVNKRGFYRYSSSKRKMMENEGQLLKGEGDPVAGDMKKVEVLNAAFTSVFPW